MKVTVVNGTNALINVSISAGVNYDWHNRLRPGEYVEIGKDAVWVTLNSRWWVGEVTEYQNSAAEIGLFVAGTVIGIAGLVLAPFSGGTSLGLTIGAIGALLGATGLAVGGISLAVKDFVNTPVSRTGVYLPDDRIFVVEGNLKFKYENDKQTLNITGADDLQLTDLTAEQFRSRSGEHGWVEARQDPAETRAIESVYHELVTWDFSEVDGGRIYPSYAGVPDVSPACWDAGRGAANADTLLQLTNGTGAVSDWKIRRPGNPGSGYPMTALVYNPRTSEATNEKAPAYHIYNSHYDCYVCVSSDEKDPHVRTKRTPDAYCLFFIIRSGNCYAFVPISRQSRKAGSAYLSALAIENGGIGGGTKVIVGDRTGPHPGWARWVVEPLSVQSGGPMLSKAGLLKLSPDPLVDAPVRIFPAVSRRHPLQKGERPLCIGIEGHRTAEGTPLQLMTEDNSRVEWVIRSVRSATSHGYSDADLFTLYCPALDRYATVAADGYVRTAKTSGDDGSPYSSVVAPSLFLINKQMGYLSFVRMNPDKYQRGPGNHILYAESAGGGSYLRVGPSNDKPALARWVVIAASSETARNERWTRS
jgi:hypothetical protein